MDMLPANGLQPSESIDVLVANDLDPMDDIHDDSHHRRSSFHHHPEDVRPTPNQDRDRGDRREREHSPDRNFHRRESDSRGDLRQQQQHHGRDHGRDDKYNQHPPTHRSSQSHDRPAASQRSRSRSRSPMRGGAVGGGVRDRRVYVGNLAYDVKWTHLKDFMREIGPVAHADVLLNHDGRSKGCGVVEYESAEDAKVAIRKLNDVVLMGRPVFVREDREAEARIGFSGGKAGSARRDAGPSSGTRQVYVGNLPYSVNWKDLKDLFRKAGAVDRADVFMNRDSRSKGSGTVSFESSYDVGQAISMFNGYDWHGRRIEVREDKFGPPSGGASRSMGPPASSRHEPSRDYGRGADSHGYGAGGGSRGGRGHDVYNGTGSSYSGDLRGGDIGRGRDINMADVPSGPAADAGGDQIYIRNLPLTTTSQDLKDLFRTCGPIRTTDMLDSAGRSKGSGIVRFELYESAHKAVARFNGYVYGGRPLEVELDRP